MRVDCTKCQYILSSPHSSVVRGMGRAQYKLTFGAFKSHLWAAYVLIDN
jgi:hypothetical protein